MKNRPSSFEPLALAVAAGAAALLLLTPVRGIFDFVFLSFIHETGHAFFGWLGGRLCIPTPMFMAVCFNENYSLPVHATVIAAFAALAFVAHRRHRPVLCRIIGGITVITALWPIVFTHDMQNMFVTFGGQAGEMLFGAFLMLSFLVTPGTGSGWAKNRWLCLGIGALSLVSASQKWWMIAFGKGELPWGAVMDGVFAPADHSGGDLNKLRDLHGWSEELMIGVYAGLSLVCILLLMGGAFLKHSVQRNSVIEVESGES